MTGKKGFIITIIVTAACAVLFAVLFFYTVFVWVPQRNYREAIAFFEQKNYDAARVKFHNLGNYKDAPEYLEKIQVALTYNQAVEAYEADDYAAAKDLFTQAGDFEDSKEYLKKIEDVETYEEAKEAFEKGDYETAESGFAQVDDYSDSEEYMKKIDGEHIYKEACELYEKKEYTAAKELFVTIPDYKDVPVLVAKMDEDLAYNDYIDRLAEYGSSVENVKQLSSGLINDAAAIWENCKNQQSDEVTDKYTKDAYGEFYKDPDTALTVYYWSDEYAAKKENLIAEKTAADA